MARPRVVAIAHESALPDGRLRREWKLAARRRGSPDARSKGERQESFSALFVDPDFVERKNIPRQNFCDAEVGYPKAQTLAARYGLAWGVEIRAVNGRFSADMVHVSGTG